MIPQPRGNHPRLTIRVVNLGVYGIIFKDFTYLLNDNRQRHKYQKIQKELLQNKNSTPNNANNTLNEELYDAQKVSPFSTSLTLEKQRRWECLVNHIKKCQYTSKPRKFNHTTILIVLAYNIEKVIH